jgi:hypothetical protein
LTLPNGIERYTGANSFAAQDATGNTFYIFQKQHDAGSVVMKLPDGYMVEVFETPADSGRPSLECNPLRGLWMVGNRESGARNPPPRYPIPEYVPFASGGMHLLPIPLACPAWTDRMLDSGESVDLPSAFGAPAASAYLVRLCGLSSSAGVTVRAGTQAAPHFLTLMTQAANIRMDCQGIIPGPVAWVSVLGSATVWLQIEGYAG